MWKLILLNAKIYDKWIFLRAQLPLRYQELAKVLKNIVLKRISYTFMEIQRKILTIPHCLKLNYLGTLDGCFKCKGF